MITKPTTARTIFLKNLSAIKIKKLWKFAAIIIIVGA